MKIALVSFFLICLQSIDRCASLNLQQNKLHQQNGQYPASISCLPACHFFCVWKQINLFTFQTSALSLSQSTIVCLWQNTDVLSQLAAHNSFTIFFQNKVSKTKKKPAVTQLGKLENGLKCFCSTNLAPDNDLRKRVT